MAKQNNTDFIDIRALVQEYLSKWYWFAISIFVFGCIGFVVAKMTNPKYSINANIIIEDGKKSSLGALSAFGDLFGGKASVDDEIFVISSHSLYKDVVKDLGINKSHIVKTSFLKTMLAYPEFPVDVIAAPGITDTLRTAIKFGIKIDEKGLAEISASTPKKNLAEVEDAKLPATIKTIYGDFVVDTTQYYIPGQEVATTITIHGYDAAAELLALDVHAGIANKRSNAITLGIESANIPYGIDILNEIVTKYNDRGIAEKNLQAQKTAAFIDSRLAIISGDLNEAEEEIQEYKEKRGIIDVQSEASYQFTKRGKTESELINAETEAEIIKMTGEFISDPNNAYSLIPMTPGSENLMTSIKEYNGLVLQHMDLSLSAKPNNRSLKRLEERIDAVRDNISSSVAKAYELAEMKVRELKTQMNKTMGNLGTVPSQEREFLNMRRQQEVKQQLYLFLLQRREETAMMLANAIPKGLIVDEAYAKNEPVSMSKIVMLLIFLFVGACIPPVVFYCRKIFRTKFDKKDEVTAIVDAPVLGEICQDHSGRNIVAVAGDHSSTTELFNLLRSQLSFILGSENKVVIFTSTNSGEGKTFVSINLAADMALLDKRVLLIGMDIRKPRLAEYLNIAPRFGLTQYLSSNDISVENMIVKDPAAPNLDIITAGPVPPNPAELLNSPRLDELIKELRRNYDYIFIDSAPVGMVSDTFTLDRLADATVYVVRANYTSRNDLRFVNDIYEQHRLKKLSIVVNGTATRRGYGYGYGEKKK